MTNEINGNQEQVQRFYQQVAEAARIAVGAMPGYDGTIARLNTCRMTPDGVTNCEGVVIGLNLAAYDDRVRKLLNELAEAMREQAQKNQV